MLSVPSTTFFNSHTLSPSNPSKSVRFVAVTVRSSAARTTARPTSYLSNGGTCMAAASFYEILGIPAVATGQEIKAAYRRLARVCHPDVAANDRKLSSADEFMKIHDAYSTLSDPAKRADYDRKVFSSRRAVIVAGGSEFAGGYSRRGNWETDQCW